MNSLNGSAPYKQSSLVCHEALPLSPPLHDFSSNSESFLPSEDSKTKKRKFKMLTEQSPSDDSDKYLAKKTQKCSQGQLSEKSQKMENKFFEITSRMETLCELYQQGFPSTSLRTLRPVDSSKDQNATDDQTSIPNAIETIVLESIARLEHRQIHEAQLRSCLKELEEEQARLKEAVTSINSWLRGNN